MAYKFIAFAALLALVNAGAYPTSHVTFTTPPVQYFQYQPRAYTPVAKYHTKNYDHEYNHHPKYSFFYDVHDSHTGDIKAQQETHDGDVVKGSYSFIEADGTRRIVEYTADDYNGFKAVVHREPAINVSHKNEAPVAYKAHNKPVLYPKYSYHH